VKGEDDGAEVAGTGGTRRGLPRGKAEDVGRTVLPAPLPIQDADRRIVGEEDGELDVPEVEDGEEGRRPGAEAAELATAPRDLGTNLDDDPTASHKGRTLVQRARRDPARGPPPRASCRGAHSTRSASSVGPGRDRLVRRQLQEERRPLRRRGSDADLAAVPDRHLPYDV